MSFAILPAPKEAITFVKFLDHLQRENSHALGFLPFQALEQAITLGRVLLCYENDEPAGYCIHGPSKRHSKIYQVCVAEDARRIEHGTALIEAVRSLAMRANAHDLILHCADDLPANSFWQELGFIQKGTRCKRKDGSRLQNRYAMDLPEKALSAMRFKKQLENDGLAKLRDLLIKGDATVANVNFHRKKPARHTIYLPQT